MRTNDKVRNKGFATRKAWTWSEATVPSWQDFRRGGEPRKHWVDYWIRTMATDVLQWVVYWTLSIMPITVVSNVGAFLARKLVSRRHPHIIDQAKSNLRHLEPTWNEQRVGQTAMRMIEGIGRLRAEFSVLRRLMPAGRIRAENVDAALAAMIAGPVVLVGVHTGNWEVILPIMEMLGRPFRAIYEPLPTRMQNYLARRTRRSRLGELLPPGWAGVRPALRYLKGGGTISIFCDEAVGGRCVAPFFNGQPHLNSNLAVAVRLARQSGAAIVPFHVVRTPDCRFVLRFAAPIALPPTDAPGARLLEDVVQLNAVIEPAVRAHIDQWYFLSWHVSGLA